MKASVKLQGGSLTIEVEETGVKQLFKAIATVQEVFGASKTCGICQAPAKFHVRTVGKFTYYEMHCSDPSCNGRLDFGQLQEPADGLWPKLVDDNRRPLANGGWYQYRPE